MTHYLLSEADRAELIRLEEGMWRQSTRFDEAFQEARFAVDFIEFGRSGRVYSRQQVIRSDPQQIDVVLPLPDLFICLLDQNTAQVMYTSCVTRDGVMECGRRSSICSRTDAGWIMRFHQGTPCAP